MEIFLGIMILIMAYVIYTKNERIRELETDVSILRNELKERNKK